MIGKWQQSCGLEYEEVEQECKKVNNGFVGVANYNCPKQIIISGERVAVEKAMELLKEKGAKRAIELKTSGPFHTIKLKDASDKLRKELENVDIKYNDEIKVIKNIDAREYKKEDDIKDILAKHIISPVRFKETIDYMIENGVDTFVEIGPGKVLSGFVKKISRDVKVYNINDVSSLKETIELLKKEENDE